VLAVCNIIYNPKKYIDYENRSIKLKPTKAEKAAQRERRKKEKAREKEDMQRFFSTEKELVFFSEASGFYKYFRIYIDYILEHSDITVHYLTADINDQVFQIKKPRFETYFCTGNGLITAFMKMDADIVAMTMPDLETYHYKRSLVRKDIDYIHIEHAIGSTFLSHRKTALNNFDTIFCYSKNVNEEIRATERVYDLKEKKLLNVGYGLLDEMINDYKSTEHTQHSKPHILIAPSWQKDNILEYCLEPLLESLFTLSAKIIIRPHPEFVKRFPGKMNAITEIYKDRVGEDFEIQTDFSSNRAVFESDVIITDWSAIAQEFSFTTKKPSLFINTPMKIMNPEWQKIGIEPMDIWIRNRVGESLDTDKLTEANELVQKMLDNGDSYSAAIDQVMSEYLYRTDNAGETGGGYIIERIKERRKEKMLNGEN
jgi:YidC/Oxa1 family membrane protein insertase